jgi:hypothetical protein
MNHHQERAIRALEAMKGDDLARAKAAFRHLDDTQMHQPYGYSLKTPAQILAEYEEIERKADEAIAWVRSQG